MRFFLGFWVAVFFVVVAITDVIAVIRVCWSGSGEIFFPCAGNNTINVGDKSLRLF